MRLNNSFHHIRLGALAVTFAMVATACAGGPLDSVQSKDTLTSVATPETKLPASTPEPTPTPPSTPEPTAAPAALFEAIGVAEFVNEGDNITLNAAVAMGGTSWLVVGMLDQPDDRRLDPVAVEIDLENPELAVSTFLPFAGSGVAEVKDLALRGDTPVAVGYIEQDGGSRPVVWERQNGAWTEVSLEAEPFAWAHTMGSDGTVALGQLKVDGIEESRLWQASASGWERVEMAPRTDLKQSRIHSAVTTETGIVAVGSLFDPITGRTSPSVWVLGTNGLEESAGARSSLPSSGSLEGVLKTENGLIAIGANTEAGVLSPIVATSSSQNQEWTITSPTITLSDHRTVRESGFSDIVTGGEALWATLVGAYTRTVTRSTDGGQTWAEVPELFANNKSGIASDVFAAQNGVMLFGGDDVLTSISPAGQIQISSPALPRRQITKTGKQIVQTNTGGLALGGNLASLGSEGSRQPSVAVWSSADGITWNQQILEESQDKRGHALVNTAQGPTYFGFGTRNYLDGLAGWSANEDGELWQIEAIPTTTEDVARGITYDAASNGITASVVGAEYTFLPDDSIQTRPVAHIVDAEGNYRLATLETSFPAESNSRIICVAASPDSGYFGVIEWAPQSFNIIASEDGSEWVSVGNTETVGNLSLKECGIAADGRWMVTAEDSQDRPYVISSVDGLVWESSPLPVGSSGAANDIGQIEGVTFAIGESRATVESYNQATIWYEASDGWHQLGNDLFTLGIEGDDYSPWTSIWSIVATDTQVLVVGRDRGRVGLWSASRDDFVAAIGG